MAMVTDMAATAVMARVVKSSKTAFQLAAPLLILATGCAVAGDWKLTRSLSLTERYTDNLGLAAGGGNSAFITEVTPRFSLSRQGARGQASLAYGFNGLLYDLDASRSSASHDLDANMRLTPVRGVLQVEGSARVGQSYASQFAPTSQGLYQNVANRVETRSLSLRPSLHNEFFERSVVLDAGLGLTYASSDSGVLNDSTGYSANFSLGTKKPERLTWGVKSSTSGGSNNNGASASTASYSANLGVVVAPKTRVFAAAGRNSSQNIALLQGRSSDFYTGGITWYPTHYYNLTATAGSSGGSTSYNLMGDWAPSPRIRLNASAGRRDNSGSYSLTGAWTPSQVTSLRASVQKNFDSAEFGSGNVTNGLSAYGFTSYDLSLNQRLRRAALGLTYKETVADSSQQYSLNGLAAYIRCGEELRPAVAGETLPEGCSVEGVPVVVPVTLNQSTYNKTWSGSLGLNLGRSSLSFLLSQSRRQYLGAAGGSDQSFSASTTWALPLSGRTSTSLNATWSAADAAGQSSDLWSVAWSMSHRINPKVSSSLTARHSQQNTNVATGDVSENSVSAQLGMTF